MSMRFLQDYQFKEREIDLWKSEVERKVADIIRYHVKGNKIIIGNMVYSINGDIVTYCEYSNYMANNETYYPVWNKENTDNYGWTDFSDCCRIYDVIVDTILANGNAK